MKRKSQPQRTGRVRVLLLAALGVITAPESLAASPPGASAEQLAAAVQDNELIIRTAFQQVAGTASGQSRSGGQAEAFVGREDLHVARSFASWPVCAAGDGNPIGKIVELARATNIVIINEHHASPIDRHFAGQVLEALRPVGYTIYAAETFASFRTHDHSQVLAGDGWYSSEPIFGRTVRLAKSLGYRLVPYEWTPEQQQQVAGNSSSSARSAHREQMQTDNLMSAIFKRDPGARVVIHVGHGHVRERGSAGNPGDMPMVAQRLKEATGRDPLTISQTTCRSPGSATVVVPAPGDQPAVDLHVGHPSLQLAGGRPAWRQAAGDVAVQVPPAFLSAAERVIVEARPQAAELGEVPIDRILLFPGERLPLLLPPGRYRLDGYLPGGKIALAPVIVEAR